MSTIFGMSTEMICRQHRICRQYWINRQKMICRQYWICRQKYDMSTENEILMILDKSSKIDVS